MEGFLQSPRLRGLSRRQGRPSGEAPPPPRPLLLPGRRLHHEAAPPPPQDRRRRSASSSSSTSDRESIRAIRLKKVLLLANPFLLPQSVFDTAIRLIGINRLCRVVC